MKKAILLLLLGISLFTLQAQQNIPPQLQQQAREELQRRGIEEDEVRARLLQRGIDIDNVTPEQLPRLQSVLEEVIREIEQEKAAAQPSSQPAAPPASEQVREAAGKVIEGAVEEKAKELAGEKAEEIQQAVREGATPQEAISEALVDEAVEDLPPTGIYGHHLFRNQSIAVYRTTNEVKPPDSYILGAGDEINVSIFGASQADLQFEIGEDGFISPSNMPRVYLKGVTYGAAKELLRNRFGQFYIFRPEQFALSINTARVITVNIFGETEQNGSFSISAVNTAFNALVAAGGPTAIGSVRNIQLMRGGRTRILDVYEFITNPSIQFDFYLENNDIIFVPLAEKIVSLAGAVKRPARYELQAGENLFDLLQYAGGLRQDAYTDLIQVRRLVDNEYVLFDVDVEELTRTGGDYPLRNGDEVVIKTVPGDYRRFVAVSGPVNYPGEYALGSEMRISDLLAKGQLREEARTDVAFLIRRNPDNSSQLIKLDLQAILDNPGGPADLPLAGRDQLTVFATSTFTDLAEVSVSGAVRNPTATAYDPNETITVQDLLLLGGGLQPNAARYGYIRRVNPANRTEVSYIKVDVSTAFNDAGAPENMRLRPFDELVVYTRERFSDSYNVSISGGVRNPGQYAYDDSLRISDVVYLSGGLAPTATDFGYLIRTDIANPERREYRRIDVRGAVDEPNGPENLVLQPGDQLNLFSRQTFTDISNVRVAGAVRNPGEYRFDPSLTVRDVLTLAGGLRLEAASNRIDVFRVNITENQPTTTFVTTLTVDQDFNITSGAGADFQLQPYDQIVVRTVPEFELQQSVALEGEVRYPGVYAILQDNEPLASVIARAGGLTPEAFPGGATLYRVQDNTGYVVVDLDEALQRPGSTENIPLRQGDIISIPKTKDIVSIRAAHTRAAEMYSEEIIQDGKISVAYQGPKNAKWYVDQYAVGVGKSGKRNRISVALPNGQLKRTKGFGPFRSYPKVEPGSVVSVGPKPPKRERPERPESTRNWKDTLAESVAAATSILTLIVLLRQINR
jgi:protein involved in polysaccharide export with SLBB domain